MVVMRPAMASAVALGAERDHPDVLAVCRWLPQPYPSGAFTGRHDRVHAAERHGLTVLWWADRTVHVGDYVGPARGGLAPGARPSYDVAMPAGGYLQVRSGILRGWRPDPSDPLVLRADGEAFDAAQYGGDHPYFLRQYLNMTDADCASALASASARRPSVDSSDPPHSEASDVIRALRGRIGASRPPVVCGCDTPGGADSVWPGSRATNTPTALLRNGGAMAVLAGIGSADDAADTVWSLTASLADPTQAGTVRAVEAAARRSCVPMSGWPDAPLTEEAVALVAAQAVRWHGLPALKRLPFWTLGWIFLAQPLLDRLFADLSPESRPALRQTLLENADAIRLQRTQRMWLATNDATLALAEMARLVSGDAPLRPIDLFPVINLTDSSAQRIRALVPEPRQADDARAYAADVATVAASLASG